ncbi:MAG: hydroxymethylbilane synthase [Eubacteriales bacterium]
MKREIRIGARDSVLALCQARWVLGELQSLEPGLLFQIIGIKTLGDYVQDVALAKIGDKGLFTKELEIALLEGKIDLAVHSMKDLPTSLPGKLSVGAVCRREWPGDVLIAPAGVTIQNLPKGALVGTSSLRRIAQLLHHRPDLKMTSVRGNLTTRLKKLSEEGLDALVLAFAGIKRLDFEELIAQKIPCSICIPAVGQGSIGVEIRENDEEIHRMISLLDHGDSRAAITAERSFMKELEGGCQAPIGAIGQVEGDSLVLEGIVLTLDGSYLVREKITGPKGQADVLGKELARKLLSKGAASILKSARQEFDNQCQKV